jgi:hypothetical integral membrane protein (TIGR02206 family)
VNAFKAFSFDHALGIGLVVVQCCLIWWLARRPRVASRLVAACILGYVVQAYAHRIGKVGLAELMPFHLCDLVLLLALGLVLQTKPSRLGCEWLYLYGCGLSVFALLTPDLYVGFPHWRFFEFFLAHGIIFMAVTYVFRTGAVSGSPGAPERALAGLVAYTLLVGAINGLFGWNYGYLCRKPLATSALDALPGWPYYIPVVLALAWAQFHVLWWPVRRWRGQLTRS